METRHKNTRPASIVHPIEKVWEGGSICFRLAGRTEPPNLWPAEACPNLTGDEMQHVALRWTPTVMLRTLT